MKNILCLCLFALLLHGIVCSVPEGNTDHWIDPLDMENFDHASFSMKKTKQQSGGDRTIPVTKEETKETISSHSGGSHTPLKQQDGGKTVDTKISCDRKASPCSALFKQFVKRLLWHMKGKVMDIEDADLNMRIHLKFGQLKTLQQYADTESDKDIHHVHEVMSSMIQNVAEIGSDAPSTRRLWIENIAGMPFNKLLTLLAITLILITTSVVFARLHFSWWRVTIKLLFFLFVISVVWTWYSMYKREEAKQHLSMMKDMPEHCKKREEKDLNFFSVISSFLQSKFTFQEDDCLIYYEHILIDPMWKIAPTEALSVTFVRFFLAPLRHIGQGIRDFWAALLKDLPVQLWPVAIAMVSAFTVLLMFMSFGYRVRLPFGMFAIEPAVRNTNGNMQQAINQQEEQIKDLKEIMKKQTQILEEERKTLQQTIASQVSLLALTAGNSSSLPPCLPSKSKPDPTEDNSGKTREDRSEKLSVSVVQQPETVGQVQG